MSQQNQSTETDPRFPSGKWTGFWMQRAFTGRQYMSAELTFRDGAVTGHGSDVVGDFEMHGTYALDTGCCSIVKTFVRAHRVSYDGRNEGDGLWIWGLWRINSDRGGFHLWPEGEDDPTQRRLRAAEKLPRNRPRIRLQPIGLPEPVEIG